MSPQQIVGVVLIIMAIGLVVWSLWPKKMYGDLPDNGSDLSDKDLVNQWSEVHGLIAKLSMLLADNKEARAKLDEVGASLYVESNWSKSNESSS